MKRKFLFIILAVFLLMLQGCTLHSHDWTDATCEAPKTCKICGATEGEPLEHVWLDATCTLPETCEICGATRGEPLGHDWMAATCQSPMKCRVCGITEGNVGDHDWIAATCLHPQRCSVCGITQGGTLPHTWVRANYESSKYCAVCGIVEGDALIPAFEKRDYKYTISTGTEWDYTTISNADHKSVTGKAKVTDYRKYYSDATHAGRSGYEWREATVEFRMPTGCKVMLGYTDTFTGMEEYASTNYITYSDGSRLPVVATESYKYDWEDEVCVSYGSLAVQVPEDYDELVFYVSSADYAYSGKVDPNIRFMEMN
ncbi:MAG: hypothetical protein K5877_11890 [Lachnospiraceae bacterium]|nr:hypothetical protein [Lachnospiraceae bacterium]